MLRLLSEYDRKKLRWTRERLRMETERVHQPREVQPRPYIAPGWGSRQLLAGTSVVVAPQRLSAGYAQPYRRTKKIAKGDTRYY